MASAEVQTGSARSPKQKTLNHWVIADPELTHNLGRIEEHGNRVLRVVFNGNTSPLRIVTVYFGPANG